MDQHSRVVTEQYLRAENLLDEAWYDEVWREQPYYENEDTPLYFETGFSENGKPQRGVEGKGRMVGEVDVWLLNRDERLMMPIEVKTNYGDATYGRDQLDRVDDHFDDWTVLKKLLVEP